tara:strand:+ start:128 stop:274 length:147 start_codon:yes stop_codon:yes gene_type:complete
VGLLIFKKYLRKYPKDKINMRILKSLISYLIAVFKEEGCFKKDLKERP